MRTKRADGFSLIELMVVLAILAILVAVGIPTFQGYRNRAFDADAQADLRTGILIESVYHLDNGSFTADTATLTALENTIRFNVSGDPAGTVRVSLGTPETEVCLFSISEAGTWWTVYHTSDGGTFYGQSAPATCDSSLASGWPTDGW